MISILRLVAGIITKSISSRVTNIEISEKVTHTPVHWNLASSLMDTSQYFNKL